MKGLVYETSVLDPDEVRETLMSTLIITEFTDCLHTLDQTGEGKENKASAFMFWKMENKVHME